MRGEGFGEGIREISGSLELYHKMTIIKKYNFKKESNRKKQYLLCNGKKNKRKGRTGKEKIQRQGKRM